MTFDETVMVTESFYKPLSRSELFSALGGALGLWIGVGMMHWLVVALSMLSKIKTLKILYLLHMVFN